MPNPLPFAAPPGTPIIGQPFTISNLSFPVNALFTCHCLPTNGPLSVQASAPVTCAACGKVYVVAFNPANGQIMVAVMVEQPKEPS